MNIVVLDWGTISQNDLNCNFLNKYGDMKIYNSTMPEEIEKRIEYADIVLCNKCILNESNLKNAKNLKCICLFATGYNNIDIDYAKNNNIAVLNVPNYSTHSVSQHTFALILEIYNRVYDYSETVKKGDWKRSARFSYFHLPLYELAGKTLGIVGFGAIGQNVAKIAKAFGMNVISYTRTPKNEACVKFVSFDELLSKADIVSLHCPLTKDNEKMMNKDAFLKMKKSAIFINTARGGLVDENALKFALEENIIYGAGIDVLDSEPMKEDCPLFGVKNLIITPHIAWAAIETRKRLLSIIDKNIECFLNNKTQNNVAL